MNTILFWAIVVAIIFMIGRYSDTIMDWLRRLVAPGLEGDATMHSDVVGAQKLSGGDQNSSVPDSLGQKIMGFAEASKESLKNTLHKVKGAAETMQ